MAGARALPWATIARALWLALLVLLLALFAAGVSIAWSQLVECSGEQCAHTVGAAWLAQSRAALGLSAAQVATYFILLDASTLVGYAAIAAILEWRRPGERMAHFAAFALLLFGGVTTCDSVRTAGVNVPALTPLVRSLAAFGGVALATCFSVFPDGRFVPTWTRGVAIVLFVAALANSVAPGSPPDLFSWSPLVAAPFAVLIVLAQTYRYRVVSSLAERQQTKWVVFGLAITSMDYVLYLNGLGTVRDVLPVGGSPVIAILQLVLTTSLALGLLVLPASIGAAILRYRLFDIDRIITGAFVYGALWLGITLAYLALTVLLAQTAAERLPVFVAVAFTLVVALIAQPARTRLETIANRWVFGNRLNGYELVRRLGNSLEQAPDPDELAQRLAATVRQGLAATWVRVWVRGVSGDERQVATDGLDLGAEADPAYTSAMVLAGETVGRIECGPKRRGDAYDARDAELLNTLGRQAALAVRNAHLADELAQRLHELARQADELAASRKRLVKAEEAGRRRIERDIHDGIQQQLVALMAKTRLARNQLGRDPLRASITLAELQEDARQALQDLRELAQGIHPAVLDDHGLVYALDSRLARIPLDVKFEREGITDSTRFTEAVEGAAYFLVSEALTNTLKHAAASHACVHLRRSDGQLVIEVSDDGRGFDAATATRRGLSGLVDRIEALGGTMRVQSSPGAGTRVTATLPAPEVAHD